MIIIDYKTNLNKHLLNRVFGQHCVVMQISFIGLLRLSGQFPPELTFILCVCVIQYAEAL